MAKRAKTLSSSIGNPSFRLDWIEHEVNLLEDKIRFLDELSFKIKGWAVTVCSGIVSVAVTQDDWRLASLSIFALVAFLITDASYKRYQICFIQRTRDIMRFLNDSSFREIWLRRGGFPIYDLLNVHTQGQVHDPLAQQWSSILKPLLKASVALVLLGADCCFCCAGGNSFELNKRVSAVTVTPNGSSSGPLPRLAWSCEWRSS